MSNFNPDYPTISNGGFLQHTYHNDQSMNDMFYYNGGAICPFGSQSLADSRRNTNMGFGVYPMQNPMMPNFGQPTQTTPVETQVMPFSTYPPSTPGGTTAPGFNSLVESRRNNFGAPVVQNNPWAVQATPQQNQMPQFQPNPVMTNPFSNPFSNPYLNPQMMGYTVEASSSALYGDASQFGFDRKAGCWDNMYTNPRMMPAPYVDWNTTHQSLNPVGQMPGYQMAYPKTNRSWVEIAEQNWTGSSL